MNPALLFTLLLALLVPSACSVGSGSEEVDYAITAEQNYTRGMERMEAEDYLAAAKYFSFVKARFPYSKYAPLAELRMADAEFGAEHYVQAIDGYKQFIKFHPSHQMVANGYAAFRICGAYYLMVPDDMWLLPPSNEKDQTPTTEAHRELTNFLKKYPKSAQVPKARNLLTKVNAKMASHEFYVAEFYWKKNKPMGTVLRLRRLLERYSGAGYDPEALYLLGKAYVEIGEPARAQETWSRLIKEFPSSDRAKEVRGQVGNTPS